MSPYVSSPTLSQGLSKSTHKGGTCVWSVQVLSHLQGGTGDRRTILEQRVTELERSGAQARDSRCTATCNLESSAPAVGLAPLQASILVLGFSSSSELAHNSLTSRAHGTKMKPTAGN